MTTKQQTYQTYIGAERQSRGTAMKFQWVWHPKAIDSAGRVHYDTDDYPTKAAALAAAADYLRSVGDDPTASGRI